MAVITVEQLVKQYFNGCVSKSKIYELVRKDLIPYLELHSRKIYFNTNEIEKWIDNGCRPPEREIKIEYGKLRTLG